MNNETVKYETIDIEEVIRVIHHIVIRNIPVGIVEIYRVTVLCGTSSDDVVIDSCPVYVRGFGVILVQPMAHYSKGTDVMRQQPRCIEKVVVDSGIPHPAATKVLFLICISIGLTVS